MTLRVNESARLAVADRNYLSLPGIAQPLEALLASFLVVAARSRTIEMQPDLTLSLLATLPEDQALLRQHVEFFRSSDTRGGGILAGLQAVRTIAELMQHSAQDLLPLARRLDNGPASGSSYQADLTQFRSALNALSTPTTALDPGSGSAALQLQVAQAALSGFLNGQMADDLTRFLTAVKEANFAG